MPLYGTNKVCEQCIHSCKQWEQLKIVACPQFTSSQKNNVKSREEDTLASG